MKRPMKKRALALVLALGMAAALSSPALAAGGDASGASVTGEPYYGTDYVQFEIHGTEGMFYDVLYNGAKIYQHVSYTDPDDDGVNPVAIELEDGQDPAGYSLVVYAGRTAKPENTVASARIAGIYAVPEGGSKTWIGSVAVPEGTAPDLTALAATFVDPTGDYDLAPGTASVPLLENGNYEIPYTRYTAPSLDARITYVDSTGFILTPPEEVCTGFTVAPGAENVTQALPASFTAANAEGKTLTYYPSVQQVTAAYNGQVDFVVLCRAFRTVEGVSGQVKIHLVADGEDGAATIHTDTIDLTDTAFYYIAPQSFVNTSNGVTTLYEVQPGQETTLTLIPGEAAEEYTIHYLPHDPATAIDWHLILVDGTTNTRIGAQTVPVEPGETVEFDAAAHAPAGYAPTQDSYSYTYGGDNLVQYVYYTPAGYVPSESYTVNLRFVNIADNAVLQSESVMVAPGADTIISCPADVSVNGQTYVRLDGQNDSYRHSYYSPKRTYTIYYRNINDVLYANTVITNTEVVTTERVEEGVTYIEDAGLVPGGAAGGTGAAGGAGGGAYATGPAAGTGVTGITDETTGLNEMLNEEGQTLNEEREEQIAEGETPLAEAPGETPTAPEEETVEENAAAKAGIRTGLMIGGTVAALGMAAVLAVLIVTQRKRNRAERR